MIGALTGKLLHTSPDHCLVNVGGVGYHVMISLSTFSHLPEPGGEVTFQIYTHVREDQISLYGFLDPLEKTLFQYLISVSGVGPRIAMSLLSGIPAMDLSKAIGRADVARLVAIPGVGKKTGERIIIELKEKILKHIVTNKDGTSTPLTNRHEEVCSALVNLGYPRASAEKAVHTMHFSEQTPIAQSIKEALKEIAR